MEAAVQAAHADIKAAVTEARSTLSSYVMGVQSSVSALAEQCGNLASATSQAATAESLQSLRDGVWKGFDDAATHRREIAAATGRDVSSVNDHVDAAVRPVAAATEALKATFENALGAQDAPLRKAAEASSTLLPGIAETVALIASQQGSSTESSAAALQTLRDGVWKGFDEAAVHRRELATAHSEQLSGVRGHLDASVTASAAPAHSALEATREVLMALRPLDSKLSDLHDDRPAHAQQAQRNADALADLGSAVLAGNAEAAKSEELSRQGQQLAELTRTLLEAVNGVREALAAKTAAGAAGTRAELERLGGGLQELSDRVDALAQAYYGTNDTVLGRMGELQVDLAGLRSSLAAAVAAPVSRAAPQPPQSPMTQQQQPAVPSPTTQQQSPQLSDSASSGGRSGAPAAGARDTEPSHEGSRRASNASAVKLLLSTREEEALRRHLLRVGGAGRYFNSKPPPSTPSAESDASGLHHYGQHSHSEPAIVSHHHHHQHHGGHADAPTGSSESVGRHSYVGAEDDDSQSRYHDALRATGHKLTERYVPASSLPGSAGHHRLSRRSVHNQSGTNFSAAESTSSASLYNRHVHHSYGSLPMRSAATETYIQHHSPPHMGGSGSEYGEAGVRGEQQQIDSASDRLVDTDLHGTAE